MLLEAIETIMLVGEPCLNPNKPDEWISVISECVSQQRGLPRRLCSGITVGCLQSVSDVFETILLRSTVFDVLGTKRPQQKRRFRMKKMEHDGCIGCTTIHVRLFTTSSEETILDPGSGETNICPFNPKSAHYPKLLMFNSPEQLQLDSPESDLSRINIATVGRTPNTNGLAPSDELAGSPISDRVFEVTDTEEISALLSEEQVIAADETVPSSHGSGCDVEVDIAAEAEEPRVTRAHQESTASPRTRNSYFSSSIPARDKKFFGRSQILERLSHAVLGTLDSNASQNSGSIQSVTANLVWLTGLEGIGKTAVAVEFAYRAIEKFDCVIWLNATSKAHLGISCHDSAIALGLVNGRVCQDHQISRSRWMDYLGRSSSRWLLVLDDCRNQADIQPYLSSNPMCSVIATGRQLPAATGWTVIQVPPFTPEEAAHCFISLLEHENPDQNAEGICAAAVRYCTSPLTLRQIAGWTTRDDLSFKDILGDVLGGSTSRGDKVELTLRLKPVDKVMDSCMGKLDTEVISWLVTLSFYDERGCTERLLRMARRKDESTLPRATSMLWRSAFLDINDSQAGSSYRMCRPVQDHVRRTVDDKTWRAGFEAACSGLSYQLPSKRKLPNIMYGFWEDFDSLHTHVHHLADCLTRDRLVDQISYDPGDQFKRLLVWHTWYVFRLVQGGRGFSNLASQVQFQKRKSCRGRRALDSNAFFEHSWSGS